MEKDKIRILAIETSCDETAAAIIEEQDGAPVVLSNIISSQVDLHAQTGGVVPEVASRAHVEAIIPVISQALLASQESGARSQEFNSPNSKLQTPSYQEAISLLSDITYIAVTAGPGLIGSLLVGFNAAKTISCVRDLPIIPINHIEGHIYSALGGMSRESGVESREKKLQTSDFKLQTIGKSDFPILALTVSGGHTSLTLMKDHGVYEALGQTLDDAVGEAYDKVAKLLGLGYPGGPAISKLATEFRKSGQKTSSFIQFPRPIMNDGTYNFSFSGLKTSVLQKTKDIIAELNLDSAADIPDMIKQEIAFAFEEAVAEVLATKTARAVKAFQPKAVIFAGGVSANQYLASRIKSVVCGLWPVEQSTNDQPQTPNFLIPPRDMTGDNAAMIGLAAYYHIKNGKILSWDKISVDSNWELV